MASILEERQRQLEKWGEQDHTLGNWGLILMEEVGEWSEAALHTQFGGPKAEGLRKEAVHVAAVALQIVQWLDREPSNSPPAPMFKVPGPPAPWFKCPGCGAEDSTPHKLGCPEIGS